jgi:hypothetical protein
VLIQTSGINMSPVPQPVLLGRIGQTGVVAKIIKEIERGAAMNTDLGDDWDFWPFVAMPLDEARLKLGGVGPKQ